MVTNDEELTDGEQWADALVKRAGEAAKTLRGKRSAKWLSDRTAALGYRLSPQVIARLDSGRRAGHLEVAELMVLAAALEVPPVLLLYPELVDGMVEVLPGNTVKSHRALSWFTGEDEEPMTSTGRLIESTGSPFASSALPAAREYLRSVTASRLAMSSFEEYFDDDNPADGDAVKANKLADQFALAKQRIQQAKLRARELGLTVDDQ